MTKSVNFALSASLPFVRDDSCGARQLLPLSRSLGCAAMAQHGTTSAARGETSSTGGPQGAGVHLDCLGLRQCAVRPETVPGFQKMCRVVDTPFSAVSASILFELRARAGEPVALAAFHQVCAPGGPGTAELFDQAVSLQKSDGSRCRSFHEVSVADRPLAVALDQAAQRVQAALGGLYVGKLDCLRSTLCSPALGLSSSGCCAACCAIQTETSFTRRLRRSAHSAETIARHPKFELSSSCASIVVGR